VARHSVVSPRVSAARVWRHLGDQRLGQPEVPGAEERALPPGQRDLGRDPPPLGRGRDAALGRTLPLAGVEGHGDPGLGCGGGGLDLLEQPDLVDPFGVAEVGTLETRQLDEGGREIHAVEHVFDSTLPSRDAQGSR
jgi:hypothetical protein